MMAGKTASGRNNDSVLEVFTIRGLGYLNISEMLVFHFKRQFYD